MTKKAIVFHSLLILYSGYSAHSEIPAGQTTLDSGGIPEFTETQSDVVNDDQSQTVEQSYDEYRLWLIENVHPLAEEARKNGIQATQEELSLQEKAFGLMFPGMAITQDDLSDEILARKYSKSIPGAFISTGDLQKAYAQLQAGSTTEPPFADILPLLEMRALLETESVQIEIGKYNGQLQKECGETLAKSSETWSASELMIHAPDNTCLAQDTADAACILTVDNYNKYIRFMSVSKMFPINEARVQAMREILRDLYTAAEARNRHAVDNDTMMANARRNWKKNRMLHLRYKNIGTPVSDPDSLYDAYSTFYDALFDERRLPCFSILGSSDSLYIDSVSHALACDTSKNGKNTDDPIKAKNSPYGFPWSHSQMTFLPEEFDEYLDSMRVNDISGVIKMPYGFFIIRYDSLHIRPAQRFEDVQDDVVFLATKRKWKNLDSLLEDEAYRIYASNKRLNQIRDTLQVAVSLTPSTTGQTAVSGNGTSPASAKRTNTEVLKDKVNGLTLLSTQLPFDVRDSLLNRFEADKDTKRMVGPITSRYGVWNFQVLDIRHGSGNLPFSFSKKRLIDSLVVREHEPILEDAWQKPDSVLDNIALAETYSPMFLHILNNEKANPNNPTERNRRRNTTMNTEYGSIDPNKRGRAADFGAWISNVSILYDKTTKELLSRNPGN